MVQGVGSEEWVERVMGWEQVMVERVMEGWVVVESSTRHAHCSTSLLWYWQLWIGT